MALDSYGLKHSYLYSDRYNSYYCHCAITKIPIQCYIHYAGNVGTWLSDQICPSDTFAYMNLLASKNRT